MTTPAPSSGKPLSLKLEFSKAADMPRIAHMLDPEVKKTYDPHGYVAKRLSWAFNEAIATGGAAFLSAPDGEVKTLTMAYHVHETDTPAPGQIHDHTELGTSFALLPGFNSAKLIVAAIVLREWLHNPPEKMMVAFIKSDNIASIKTYRDALGWREVPPGDEHDRAIAATDKTLVIDPVKANAPVDPNAPTEHLYSCDNAALAMHAQILLEFMKQGGLINHRTGQKIDVDFSALAGEGLSVARIEAIALGITSRDTILQIS